MKIDAILHSIIEGSTDAIYVKDTEGRYVLFNAAASSVTGKSANEVIGRDDTFIFPANEAEVVMATDAEIMRSGVVSTYEEHLTAADGSHRCYLSTKGPIFHPSSGAVCGLFGIARDITERKQAQEELQKKNDEIEKFTFTVSHDLRSPLVTVRTFLGYLEQDIQADDSERIKQDLGFIRAAADKMDQLLNELLEMSRIGRHENPASSVTFRELAQEALASVAGQIAGQNVAVQVADIDLYLTGDRPRLAQIWQNLLDNAVKYLGDQPAPRVELGVEQQNGEMVFFVRDNGIGIAPGHRNRIFGMFDKLDISSSGVGLGLAMVKKIVEKYNGRIWVESNGEGRGSCFRFTLPGGLPPKGES